METTTSAEFWEGIASSAENMILGNNSFFILLAQTILIVAILSSLFIMIMKAFRGLFKRKR